MSEFPPEAEALLSLVKDVHDPPDPQARSRVRQRVAITVAGGAAAAVSSKAFAHGAVKASLFSKLFAKVAVASVVAVSAGTLAVTQLGSHKSSTSIASDARKGTNAERGAPPQTMPSALTPVPASEGALKPKATLEAKPAQIAALHEAVASDSRAIPERAGSRAATPSGREGSPAVAGRATRSSGPKPPTGSGGDSLLSEMRLLRNSSDALSVGDAARAFALLEQYRSQFPKPMLRDEHDGLRVLARCQLGEVGAQKDAERFLENSKTSVLRSRIVRACKLDGGT